MFCEVLSEQTLRHSHSFLDFLLNQQVGAFSLNVFCEYSPRSFIQLTISNLTELNVPERDYQISAYHRETRVQNVLFATTANWRWIHTY